MTNQKTIRITTISGSEYELDKANKRVRRLFGKKTATKRQGADGEWKKYESVTNSIGGGLLFDWDGEGHCTLTSKITKRSDTGKEVC